MTKRQMADMSDVDAAGSASVYLELMKVMETQARRYKARSHEMLRLERGQRVLDLACGGGDDLLFLAEQVMPGGEVIGIDRSREMLVQAEAKIADIGLPVSVRQGDACALDLPDAAFDRCRAERLLQHLVDPARAIAEMVRVLKPNGRLVLVSADWDGMLIDADDAEVNRVVVRRRSEAAPSGGIGRQLKRRLLEAGLVDLEIEGVVFLWPDHDIAMTALDLPAIADAAVADGELPAERVENWKTELAARGQRGQFLLSTTGFIVAASRP